MMPSRRSPNLFSTYMEDHSVEIEDADFPAYFNELQFNDVSRQ